MASLIENEFTKEKANFAHSLYGQTDIPRNAIQKIVTMFALFITNVFISYLKDQFKIVCDTSATKSLQFDEICKVLDDNSNPLQDIISEYRRFKLFSKFKLSINPIEFILGKKFETTEKEGSTVTSFVSAKAHWIPLKETLVRVFSNFEFLQLVKGYVKQLLEDTTVLSNFIQGQYWREKLKHYNDKFVLPLILYHDDFESGNALGSHHGTNSIGVLYAFIPCLPPQFAALLDHIYTVLVFRSHDRKTFGNYNTFRHAIDEINEITANGIEVEHEGKKEKIYFELGLITGDNLGLNSIFEFVESFSANFCCRLCKMAKSSLNVSWKEDESLLRSKENYEADLKADNYSETGIHDSCVFNAINGFHICVNTVVDALHDIAEGVCFYTMQGIIDKCISESWLTLQEINRRLTTFDFSACGESNKPPPLKNGKIKMSAAEMICFCRYFGVLFGDLIPDNDEHWSLYLKLREIVEIVTSHRILHGHVSYLKNLIEEHNYLFLKKIGPLKPKMHFILHYHRIIRNFGPLTQYWTMRYESKHRHLKRTTNNLAGSVNITKSIAISQCFKISQHASSIDVSSEKLGSKAHRSLQLLIPQQYVLQDTEYFNWVIIKGTKYALGKVVLLEMIEDELPKFGKIKVIFKFNGVIMFAFQPLITKCFYEKYNAYEVVEDNCSNENHIVSSENFNCSEIFPFFYQNGQQYVLYRHV
ncbi:uncharacterized protein LOC127286967 [Leptopilina boulardi]|uniref:uncharacterized protein LOC127286967 n=1 Tax=Leptopilina boulardi TaxID=63433 RepID=UPI0021F68F98|nr:uncharacterized protein LOC127286967 [Leptopilina boulardi]